MNVLRSTVGPRRGCRHRLATLLLFLIVCVSPASPADRPSEYHVKAAFLLKFVPFIDWPEGDAGTGSNPIRIGLVGPDPFKELLPERIPSDGQNAKTFVVSRITAQSEKIDRFHILYFTGKDPKDFASIQRRIDRKPILTIGEGEAFVSQGGMIGFILENESIRFLIHLKSARKAGLAINARLLSLAKSVVQ